MENKMQIPSRVMILICDEIEHAEKKHPFWPTSLLHQVAILNEESGEVTKSVLHITEWEKAKFEHNSTRQIQKEELERFYTELEKELAQTAAMAIRMLSNLRTDKRDEEAGSSQAG